MQYARIVSLNNTSSYLIQPQRKLKQIGKNDEDHQTIHEHR